jgi:hypothetical protein
MASSTATGDLDHARVVDGIHQGDVREGAGRPDAVVRPT